MFKRLLYFGSYGKTRIIGFASLAIFAAFPFSSSDELSPQGDHERDARTVADDLWGNA
jgi:hypothetical protein